MNMIMRPDKVADILVYARRHLGNQINIQPEMPVNMEKFHQIGSFGIGRAGRKHPLRLINNENRAMIFLFFRPFVHIQYAAAIRERLDIIQFQTFNTVNKNLTPLKFLILCQFGNHIEGFTRPRRSRNQSNHFLPPFGPAIFMVFSPNFQPIAKVYAPITIFSASPAPDK